MKEKIYDLIMLILNNFYKFFGWLIFFYLLIAIFVIGWLHFNYDKKILGIKKEKDLKIKKLKNRPGIPRGIMEGQIMAESEPFNKKIKDLEYRRELFLDKIHILLPFIKVK